MGLIYLAGDVVRLHHYNVIYCFVIRVDFYLVVVELKS